MAKDFCLSGYENLIQSFLNNGYGVKSFHDVEAKCKHLVLRHDIDIDISAAVKIAELEAALGVASVYFVLVRTEIYNLFSKKGLQGLKRILARGHEVGLHFDASLYQISNFENLETLCDLECRILETALGVPIKLISFHRPAKQLIGTHQKFSGRRHVYEDYFVNQIGYCSDSRGQWRFGHPLEHAAVQNENAIHLCTHPIWWYREQSTSVVGGLNEFVQKKSAGLEKELAKNCIPYSEYLSSSTPLNDDTLSQL